MEARLLLSGGPRIVFSSVRDGGEYVGTPQMYFKFDRPVATPGGSDFILRSADDPLQTYPFGGAPSQDLGQLRMTFPYNPTILPPGRYTLTLLSGTGHLHGTDGAAMDGELPPNGFVPTGDGVAGGDYSVTFSTILYGGAPSPKELTATPLSDHEIELQWYDDTDEEYTFDIERADGDGPFTEIVQYRNGTDRNPAHYIDAGVEPGHTYRYRARADIVGGYLSPYSNETFASVLPSELALPVTGLSTLPNKEPDWLTSVNGDVYFTWTLLQDATSWGPNNSEGLWKTDGTSGGTVQLYAGQSGSLINFNGTLFFAGYDETHGLELWKSDGTAAHTELAVDVKSGADSSSPVMLGIVGSNLFFAVPHAGHAYELWKTDGTSAGTAAIGDVMVYLDNVPETSVEARRLFTVSGGFLYFRGANADGTDKSELWRSDGSVSNTIQVAGVANPTSLTDLGGTLFCASRPTVAPGTPAAAQLYKVPQASTSALLVKTLPTVGGGWVLTNLTAVGPLLYFAGTSRNASLETQMWQSDGTPAGTLEMNFAAFSSGATVPHHIANVDGRAFFLTNDFGANEYFGALRLSDGTIAGTTEVREFEGRRGDGPFYSMSAGTRYLYTDGLDLWTSDGSWQGTYKIDRIGKDFGQIQYGPRPRSTSYLFSGAGALTVGDKVFYSVRTDPDRLTRELRVASLTPPAAPSGVTAGAPPVTAPTMSKPQSVTAGVVIRWSDNATNETGYVIDRLRSGGGGLPLATFYAPANATSYTDTGATGSEGYVYRIRSYNAARYSAAVTSGTPLVNSRYLFFNNSAADGNGAGPSAADDSAIASGKTPLLPGGIVSSANFSGYSKGINGIMVDIVGLPAGTALSANDFSFRSSTGGSWTAGPVPSSVTVRRGVISGIDRITLIWPESGVNGAVQNGWLEVTVKATANTGLTKADVFAFGNLVGDADGNGAVSVGDLGVLATNFNKTTGATLAQGDFNGDGAVTVGDLGILSTSFNRSLTGPPTLGLLTEGTVKTATTATSVLRKAATERPRYRSRLQ